MASRVRISNSSSESRPAPFPLVACLGDTASTEASRQLADFGPWGQALSLHQRLTQLEKTVAGLQEQIAEQPLVYNAQVLDLGDVRYALLAPLLVTIELYEDEVIAKVLEFDLYASGVSDSVALLNLKSEIVSTFERLEEIGAEQLGPMALQALTAMRKIIERVNG